MVIGNVVDRNSAHIGRIGLVLRLSAWPIGKKKKKKVSPLWWTYIGSGLVVGKLKLVQAGPVQGSSDNDQHTLMTDGHPHHAGLAALHIAGQRLVGPSAGGSGLRKIGDDELVGRDLIGDKGLEVLAGSIGHAAGIKGQGLRRGRGAEATGVICDDAGGQTLSGEVEFGMAAVGIFVYLIGEDLVGWRA